MRCLGHPYARARLISLRFEAAPNVMPAEAGYPPIAVEDGAFVSWWRPTWRERLQILCGVPVRVLVNYALYGPLHLDARSGWGHSCGASG